MKTIHAYSWTQLVEARTATSITLNKSDIGVGNKPIIPLGIEAGTRFVQITPTGQNSKTFGLLAHNVSEKVTIKPILYYFSV